MTSVDRFVEDARRALTTLIGAGAAGATPAAPRTWSALATRANELGLADLAARCDAVAGELGRRGALAFEASVPLADAALAVHDRVEALASALAIWSAQTSLSDGQMKEETR